MYKQRPKNWINAVPQQEFGQQHAALPKKLQRYARMHTCNPWPVVEHMAQMHASRLSIFICGAFSSEQVPSEMILLTLQRRESSWFSLCQHENLLDEAKQVDVRLRRNEGREGKSFSNLVRRKQRLVTAKQFFLSRLRSGSVVRRPWTGALTSCHQQTTQEAKDRTSKMLPRTDCHELDRRKVVWVDARLLASAGMMTRSAPASQLIWSCTCTTRHEHTFEYAHQGSDMVTFKLNLPSFAVLIWIPAIPSKAFPLHHCHKPCRWLVAYSDRE